MSDAALRQLALRAGLLPRWRDYRGRARTVATGTLRALLGALDVPCSSPAQIAESRRRLAAEPPDPALARGMRAFRVGDVAVNRRLWGIGAQLYSLRCDHDGGLGHYTALADLARHAAAAGADALAISPAHAAFSGQPARYSPYAPSSRLLLNAWHIDPDAVPGGTAVAARSFPSAELVDWPRAARERLRQLRREFDHVAPVLLDPASRA